MNTSVSAKQFRSLALVGAIATLTSCSLLPNSSSDNAAIDSVSSSQSSLQYSDAGYENKIGRHIYAAAGLGLSRLEPDTSEAIGTDLNDRVEGAGQVTLGLDINRMFSVELHSADLGSAGLSPPNGRINYHIHGASALFYVGGRRGNYRRQGLNGFGRVGYGLLENTPVGDVDFVQDNSTHFLLGAGVEYMSRIGLGVRAEAVSHEKDVKYAQLALVYRTGKRRTKRPVQIVEAPKMAPVVVPALKVVEQEALACVDIDSEFHNVHFITDSSTLNEEGLSILSKVAKHLNECKNSTVNVSAHTDSVGSEEYNQFLSERRAKSVSKNLNSQGVEMSRINTQAFGETQPIDTNATAEGRRNNRRVEVQIER